MREMLKIGEVAELTGLTVRTLRYYDQINLFSPSVYTDVGHRLYDKSDLFRLQQILSLKYIGLSLEDIQTYLSSDNYNVIDILSVQVQKLKDNIQVQQNLLNELINIQIALHNEQGISIDELIKLLGVMKMNREDYFSKEQLDQMRSQYENMDKNELKASEEKFNLLMTDIRDCMEKGIPTTDEKVQGLVSQWKDMLNHFAPKNDSEFMKSAEEFHKDNPDNKLQYGVDKDIYIYINKALKGI